MAIKTARAQINGQWYTLTYNPATLRWEAQLQITSSSIRQPGGYYNVTVEATNETGKTVTANGGTMPALRLVVQERVKPEIKIVSPSGKYVTDNRANIVLDVTDDDSGANMATFSLTVDGVQVTAGYTAITGGYRVTYAPPNPLAEGPHSITAQVTDFDGNTGYGAAEFTVDTIPPVLKAEAHHLIVDEAEIVIAGSASDASVPVRVKVKNGGFAADLGTTFSVTVPLNVGDNHIIFTATDAAGLETVSDVYAIRLVTDRTQNDVDRLLRLREAGWERMSAADRAWYTDTVCRGAYNAEDMNRVNRAMAYLSERYRGKGYSTGFVPQIIHHKVPIFSDKPDEEGYYVIIGWNEWDDGEWIEDDILNQFDPQETQKFLANVDAFNKMMPTGAAPPTPPDMDGFTYTEANNIETILVIADTFTQEMDVSAWYAGELMAGMA